MQGAPVAQRVPRGLVVSMRTLCESMPCADRRAPPQRRLDIRAPGRLEVLRADDVLRDATGSRSTLRAATAAWATPTSTRARRRVRATALLRVRERRRRAADGPDGRLLHAQRCRGPLRPPARGRRRLHLGLAPSSSRRCGAARKGCPCGRCRRPARWTPSTGCCWRRPVGPRIRTTSSSAITLTARTLDRRRRPCRRRRAGHRPRPPACRRRRSRGAGGRPRALAAAAARDQRRRRII